MELLNSILSNINDDGDNNEKTKNLKTRLGIFKNMGGNFPGRNIPGGSLMGGDFEFCEISKNSFFYSTPLVAASVNLKTNILQNFHVCISIPLSM